jgi:hypothetical protein
MLLDAEAAIIKQIPTLAIQLYAIVLGDCVSNRFSLTHVDLIPRSCEWVDTSQIAVLTNGIYVRRDVLNGGESN